MVFRAAQRTSDNDDGEEKPRGEETTTTVKKNIMFCPDDEVGAERWHVGVEKKNKQSEREREREKLVRFLIPPLLPCALVQPWRSYASRSAYRLQVQEVSSNCFIISTPLNCSGSLAYNNVLCGLFFFLPTSFFFFELFKLRSRTLISSAASLCT